MKSNDEQMLDILKKLSISNDEKNAILEEIGEALLKLEERIRALEEGEKE